MMHALEAEAALVLDAEVVAATDADVVAALVVVALREEVELAPVTAARDAA